MPCAQAASCIRTEPLQRRCTLLTLVILADDHLETSRAAAAGFGDALTEIRVEIQVYATV